MANSEEIFQVRITTPVELDGAKRLADQLERDRGVAIALGKDLGEIDAQLTKVRQSISEANVAPEVEKRSARELREELGLLGQQAGPLGEILRNAVHPEVAGVAFFAAALEGLRQVFETLAKPVEQYNEAILAVDAAKIKAVADATHDAAKAASDFADAQAKLDAQANDADKAMTARIKAYNDESDAVLKVNEAQEKAFESEIDRRAALGQITKEQAAAAKEKARFDLDAARGSTDQAKLQNEIAERQQARQAAHNRLPSDRKALAAAQAAETPGAEASAEIQAKIDAANKQIIDAGSAGGTMEELKKQAQDFRNAAEENRESGTGQAPEELEAQAAAIDQAVKAQEAYIANLQKLKDRQDGANASAKTATDIARDKEAADLATQRDAPEQIATLQAQLALMQQTQAAAQAAPAGAGGAVDAFFRPRKPSNNTRQIDVQDALHAAGYGGGRIDPLAASIRTALGDADTAIAHAEREGGLHGTVAVLIDKVTHMAALLRRTAPSGDSHNQLQRAIDRIEREIAVLSSRQSVNRAN